MNLRDNELTQNTAAEKNRRLMELLQGSWRTQNLKNIAFEVGGDGSQGRWVADSI